MQVEAKDWFRGLFCIRDGSGKPTAKRGLAADSPTRSGAKGNTKMFKILLKTFSLANSDKKNLFCSFVAKSILIKQTQHGKSICKPIEFSPKNGGNVVAGFGR